jgi:hypothetical protein
MYIMHLGRAAWLLRLMNIHSRLINEYKDFDVWATYKIIDHDNTATAATSVSRAELCVLALGNPPAEDGPDHTRPK